MKQQSTGILVARWIGAVIFALLAAFSIPATTAAHWMKNTILNTERVVELLSPLSENVKFQNFLATSAAQQTTVLVEENLPVGTINTLASGFGSLLDSLPIDLNLGSALDSPGTALADSIASVVQQQTLAFVQGPNFPPVWDAAVRETHGQFVALMENKSAASATSSTLEINVAPLIATLRSSLLDEGEWWAEYIPTVDALVPIVEVTNLAEMQRYYDLAQQSEQWMTWSAVAFALLALVLAPKRLFVLGIGALATFLTSAFLWRAVPQIGEDNFRVLVEGEAAAVTAQVWTYLSDPLTTAVQGVAGGAIIVAIISLGAGLGVYIWSAKKKKGAASQPVM